MLPALLNLAKVAIALTTTRAKRSGADPGGS